MENRGQNVILGRSKKDKSKDDGYICEVNTIERSLNQAYVYSSKDIIVILNTDGRLYQYDYDRKITTEVDLYVDSVSALGSSTGMYMSGAEHLNAKDDADSYIYSVSENTYYVETKTAKATLLKGVSGAGNMYVYDKKNDYVYWLSNKNYHVQDLRMEKYQIYCFLKIPEII